MAPTGEITERLLALRGGDQQALDQLVPLVYERLRDMAHARLRGQAPGASLDTTALVHEAYLRLVDQSRAEWKDRGHFFAVAATAMRQIVVDRARRRSSAAVVSGPTSSTTQSTAPRRAPRRSSPSTRRSRTSRH
jgi:RNA polymerase sigma factor (TIGR02999 family)